MVGYPDGIEKFLRFIARDPILAGDYAALAQSVLAIETELGLQPAFPFPSVADYLRGLTVKAGKITGVSFANGAAVTVTFPVGTFIGPPAVFATLNSTDSASGPASANDRSIEFVLSDVQATQFSMKAFTRFGFDVNVAVPAHTVGWMAVGPNQVL